MIKKEQKTQAKFTNAHSHRKLTEISRRRWSDEEDQLLARWSMHEPALSWDQVAERMQGRTTASCMGRWYNHLATKGVLARPAGPEGEAVSRPRVKTDSRKRAAVLVVASETDFQQSTKDPPRRSPTKPKQFISAVLDVVLSAESDSQVKGKPDDEVDEIIDLSPPNSPPLQPKIELPIPTYKPLLAPIRHPLPPIVRLTGADERTQMELPSIGSWYKPAAALAPRESTAKEVSARPWYSSTVFRQSSNFFDGREPPAKKVKTEGK